MMCKEIKEDLKRIRRLKDVRKDVKNSKDVTLGFVEEEDYRALLVIGGVSYGKELVIDFSCSFNICFEK